MVLVSLFGSLLLIGLAAWTMGATLAPSLGRIAAALAGTPTRSAALPAWQRRPLTARARVVRFSRPELRAAA